MADRNAFRKVRRWLHRMRHPIRTAEVWDALDAMVGIQLDIGCGANKQPLFVGIDARPLPGVDVVWNVEEFPWPLPSECAVRAISSHLVEHIDPHGGVFVRFMDEVWRVLKPGAQFAISVPHGYSPGYLQDPTHCNPCNEATWFYFTPPHPLWTIYQPKPWKMHHLSYSYTGNMEVLLTKIALPLEEANDGTESDHNGSGQIGDDATYDATDPPRL